MARLKQQYASDGFYGIGILNAADETNIGTLWRSAFIMGASFIFTIEKRYKKQSSDVTRAWSKIPLYHYGSFEEFRDHLPYSTQLIGVELAEEATPLSEFTHPTRAAYLLGCESDGIPRPILDACHGVICLPGHFSLNVASAGSIIACDRAQRVGGPLPGPPSAI